MEELIPYECGCVVGTMALMSWAMGEAIGGAEG